MNKERLIKSLTDAILDIPLISREKIEDIIKVHVSIENKRSVRARQSVRDAEHISVDKYKKSLDDKVWLKDQEIQLYRRKLQELTKGTDRYKQIRNRVDKALVKIKQNRELQRKHID